MTSTFPEQTYLMGEFSDGLVLRLSVTNEGVEIFPPEYRDFDLDELDKSDKCPEAAPTLKDEVMDLFSCEVLEWN